MMPSNASASEFGIRYRNENIEAVLLNGGASRRMGQDKAKLLLDGEPLAQRIARLIIEEGIAVTVLGREPVLGCRFMPDEEDFRGPLAALARFKPEKSYVFLCSCDLPGFTAELISSLAFQIEDYDAAVPLFGGRLQPLCALYRSSAMDRAAELVNNGEQRIMRWLELLRVREVNIADETWAANVNTREEWLRWTNAQKPAIVREGQT